MQRFWSAPALVQVLWQFLAQQHPDQEKLLLLQQHSSLKNCDAFSTGALQFN